MIAVLICVATAVLLFGRRPTPVTRASLPTAANDLVMLRGNMSLSVPGQSSPSHQPIPDAGEPIDWRAIDRERARDHQPPVVRSVPVSRAPRLENLPRNADVSQGIVPPQPAAVAEPERATRYHRIVEGDTLRDLAHRYLGSADRYLELFYANRAVLPHPDVLPLHARIVIPESADPLASGTNPYQAAEKRAASPWNSRPLSP